MKPDTMTSAPLNFLTVDNNELKRAAIPFGGFSSVNYVNQQDSVLNVKISQSQRPYLSYSALLNERSPGVIVASILENQLTEAIVWTKQDIGVISGDVSSNIFTSNYSSITVGSGSWGIGDTGYFMAKCYTENTIKIHVINGRTENLDNPQQALHLT